MRGTRADARMYLKVAVSYCMNKYFIIRYLQTDDTFNSQTGQCMQLKVLGTSIGKDEDEAFLQRMACLV